MLRDGHFETSDRHIQFQEIAQRGRPNAGQARQPVVDEGGPAARVVEHCRLGARRHVRYAVQAGSRIAPCVGHGEDQIAQFEPAAVIGQGQSQAHDLDADGLALSSGHDTGEAQGFGRIGGKAASQPVGQVPAQGFGIERSRCRYAGGRKAETKKHANEKTAHWRISRLVLGSGVTLSGCRPV